MVTLFKYFGNLKVTQKIFTISDSKLVPIKMLLVIVFIYYQFLMPIRNPSIINCIVPTDVSAETIQLLFGPTKLRTTLMFLAFLSYVILFFVSIYKWKNVFTSHPGIKLFQNVLSQDLQRKLKIDKQVLKTDVAFSDLNLIFALVLVNKNRLQYIK